MKTGNTGRPPAPRPVLHHASMEPGHEDREYKAQKYRDVVAVLPQWSPVMKTGNTGRPPAPRPVLHHASMEPGHEDREYPSTRYCS